ncbi:MAG TPA: PAS domain-containing sensor histidine kinase [Puia sp.]|nr:PAS domain-containing sensor histidine kinase [Puia sp.]
MLKEKKVQILVFCGMITICTVILQFINPTIHFFDYGLIAAVMLTVFLKNDNYTWLFGIIAVIFIVVSAFYKHPNMSSQQVLTQHLFSGIFMVLTILVVLYVKKLYRSIESDGRQLNALFEHATEGIILTNDRGHIVLANPAAVKMFLYEKEDLLDKSIEALMPDRFHMTHLEYRNGFYKHPSSRTMGHGRDLFAKRRDGTEFPVEVSLSFYHQKNNFFVIAFIVDITSRKKSEQEMQNQKIQLEKITEDMRKLNIELETKVEQRTLILREALQELEKSQGELSQALNKEKELNEIKSRFVSMASHEFRTPLSTVLSSAALISKYTKTEEQDKRDRHIKRIKDSVRHLNMLLEDFLSLGKLEQGKIRAEIGKFSMKEFMEEIVDEMKAILKDRQVINAENEGNDEFCSDKRLLKNILINLLSNAIKFSEEGSAIWLHMNNQRQELQLKVRDEGIGISEEDQEHLFSSFFRGRNVLNIEGTGLGLHIVKRYVDLLNGSVALQSRIGHGTTITVIVPQLDEP